MALVATLVVLAAPAAARADTVSDWNLNASNALFNTAAQSPPVGSQHMAMVHGAVYDAVNAVDRRYQPYLYTNRNFPLFSGILPWASKDAAAATAAYKVLISIVPAQQPALQQLYLASLATIPEWAGRSEGTRLGEEAAAAMIAARTNDGRFGAPGFPVGVLPGQWRPVLPGFVNDPNGWIRNVKPFLLQSPSQFRSAGPFALTSADYAAEFNEVKSVGSLTSTTRTAAQTNASLYWAEHSGRTWNRIFRTISAQHTLTPEESARLFAMLNMSFADTAINVWDDKAFWSFWRPITAIREAHLDGNPATTADPDWLPLIVESAVSGSLVRSLGTLRGGHEDAATVLRDESHRLDGHQRRWPDAKLQPRLGRDGRGRRSTHLVGNPLPARRRARCTDRAAGRRVGGRELLPPASRPLKPHDTRRAGRVSARPASV